MVKINKSSFKPNKSPLLWDPNNKSQSIPWFLAYLESIQSSFKSSEITTKSPLFHHTISLSPHEININHHYITIQPPLSHHSTDFPPPLNSPPLRHRAASHPPGSSCGAPWGSRPAARWAAPAPGSRCRCSPHPTWAPHGGAGRSPGEKLENHGKSQELNEKIEVFMGKSWGN